MKITVTPNPNHGMLPASDKLGFGTVFTDHMFLMDYSPDQGWHDARIVPYGPLTLDPAASVLHYGQACFEGLKAYRGPAPRSLKGSRHTAARTARCSCSDPGRTSHA